MLTHTCLSLAYPSMTNPLLFSYKSLTKPLFFLQILLTHPYVYKAPGAQRSPGGIPPSIAWNYPSLSLSLSVFLYSLSLVGFSASLKASVFKSIQAYRSSSISLGSDRVWTVIQLIPIASGRQKHPCPFSATTSQCSSAISVYFSSVFVLALPRL